MRIPRIHHPEPLSNNHYYQLSKEASQHLLKVLRLNIDDEVILFDGNGHQITTKIIEITGKQVRVRSIGEPVLSPPPKLNIHLGLAISKGDRMDYAIQKAVEAGVNAITPLVSERTVVKLDESRAEKRHAHWHAIIINACEQCGQNYLPQLLPVVSIKQWTQQNTSALRLFFDATVSQTLHTIEPQSDVRVTVGPEGGLSDDELNQLKSAGFSGVRLGPRILRTETAAVSACVALQTLWGDYC